MLCRTHIYFRVLSGILSVSIDTVYDYPFMLYQGGNMFYVKCEDHRLVQDQGSSPGTLSGCAPVRTQGPSHKSYGKPKRDCIKWIHMHTCISLIMILLYFDGMFTSDILYGFVNFYVCTCWALAHNLRSWCRY